MELVNRYLQAVRFWLPRAQQEDIIAELSEDLHSQIEERETALGRPLERQEVEAILKQCGSPRAVAGRYQHEQYLIGPALFPIYRFVLRMVLLWILVPVFLLIVGPIMVLNSADHLSAAAGALGTLCTSMFVSAAIITLIFALLDRADARFGWAEKWSPQCLPPVQKNRRGPSPQHSVFEVICAVVGLGWLLAVPSSPFLIFGPAAAFLKPAPIWSTFYWPILGLAILSLLQQSAGFLRPQWNCLVPALRMLNSALGMTVLYFLLQTSMASASTADWHPFVIPTGSIVAGDYLRTVAIVNVSVLVTLLFAWVGTAITTVNRTWQFLKFTRSGNPQAREPAPLQPF